MGWECVPQSDGPGPNPVLPIEGHLPLLNAPLPHMYRSTIALEQVKLSFLCKHIKISLIMEKIVTWNIPPHVMCSNTLNIIA